jgi:carbonic anhydrase/acetyltransferase-like protein (isoleucine patch superfamily)
MIYQYKDRVPDIAETSYVAENATVIGEVVLGEESSIWFGSVLRGDIEPIIVGARSNIQDNSVAHTSNGYPVILGEDVTVGHKVTLHGCKVGNNCLIGMGSVLLDGCEIGDNCIVGAGALVKQGYKVPAGSLVVGSPARVIRTLSEDDFANIRRFSVRYVELLGQYKSGAVKPVA